MNQVDAVRRLLIPDREFEEVHSGIPAELMRRRLDALGYDWQALVDDCARGPELRVFERQIKHGDTFVETRIGISVTWSDGTFDTQKEHLPTRIVPHGSRNDRGDLVHKFGVAFDPKPSEPSVEEDEAQRVERVVDMLVSDEMLREAVGETFPLDCMRRRFHERRYDWSRLMRDVEGAKVWHENGKHGKETPTGIRIVKRTHIEWPDGIKDVGETLYVPRKS